MVCWSDSLSKGARSYLNSSGGGVVGVVVWFLALRPELTLLFEDVALASCGAAGKCNEGLMFRRGWGQGGIGSNLLPVR